MEPFLAYFANWPYLVWALGAATTFYMVTIFAISHLNEDKKANLSLWLQGDYESTWSAQFCAMFDAVFGEKHWHLRCILLSAIASVAAVFGLWLLLDHILGLISLRADTGLSLTQALLLGAAINIIPDYLSLYETRWLLQRFERIRNPIAQILVLLADAVLTGFIIYAGIQAYLWFSGEQPIALVEMVALFSFYAIFFYSTFLTSIWAWAYCLSSWVVKIGKWLDAKNSPGRALALIGATFVLLGSLAIRPALEMDQDGRIALDDFLCETFPASACNHVGRITKDQSQKLELWKKSCEFGDPGGCTNLGVMYEKALGVEKNLELALKYYNFGCDGGTIIGCYNLGIFYFNGIIVAKDYVRAGQLFKIGCDGEDALSCNNLGMIHDLGLSTKQDFVLAARLFERACKGGNPHGCTNLGLMFEVGRGVPTDLGRAVELHKQGCAGGNAAGCTNLGLMYEKARGVAQDYARAVDLYKQACDDGNALGCNNLGWMHVAGTGVYEDDARAAELFKQACDGGEAVGCGALGNMYKLGLGVDVNLVKARTLLTDGCGGGSRWSCDRLSLLLPLEAEVE